MLIALTNVGHAIYLRSSRLAIIGGLLIQTTTVAAYLMSGVGAMNEQVWVRLATYAAIAGSVYALLWMAYRNWRGIGRGLVWRNDNALAIQTYLPFGFLMAIVSYLLTILIKNPGTMFPLEVGASVWSWIAWCGVLAGVVWLVIQSHVTTRR